MPPLPHPPARHSRSSETGAALLIVIVAVVVVTLSGALAHRAAVDTLRHARTMLAVLRAQEASSSGIATALAGGPVTGTLPGGASWVVNGTSAAGGDVLFHATGSSAPPFPAVAEALAVVDSAGRVVRGRVRVWR